jgi:hypothetical protein
VDCGGDCTTKCGTDARCGDPEDCASGVCTNAMCKAATCSDTVKNGDESDADCGGTCPLRCDDAKACLAHGDCTSGVCTNSICQAPLCNDNVKNGNESDLDCGGADCGDCGYGKICRTNDDCSSTWCQGATCKPELLLNEIQSRGNVGATDEFIELYNPTDHAISFTSDWTIEGRGLTSGTSLCSANNYNARSYTVTTPLSIPSHGFLLLANTGSNPNPYNGATAYDLSYTNNFNDAASIVLKKGSTVIDAVCFHFDTSTQGKFTCAANAFVCEGASVDNMPHDQSTSVTSNTDVSIERRRGGDGEPLDTNVSANDWIPAAGHSSTPQSDVTP